ncbi:MAG: glycosyltransferase family 39 protein [Planctomycetaceae bacterium]|nr:glycosyltransferase family 39 protein [Planctomycetaceae bacterium]
MFWDRMDATTVNRRWLVCVLTLALGLRVSAAIGLQAFLDSRDPPRTYLIAGDAEGYWDLAGDLAEGREYAVYTPPRRVLRTPGFPFVLAIPRFLFGDALLPARLWLAAVGTLACWGVWRFTSELVDVQAGVIAAFIAAVAPVMIGFTPVILSETTFAATMLLSLIGMARLLRRHRGCVDGGAFSERTAGLAVATGIASAAATYVRPSWLLIAPLFCGVLWAFSGRHRTAARDGAIVCAALVVSLLPWGVRNYYATEHFVLTSLWMGPSLYDGLNPEATGDSNMAFFDRDNLLGQGMGEYDVNRHYRELAWKFARENPTRTLELAAAKFWRYWKPWPNAEQFRSQGLMVAVAASFVPVLGFAVVGLWRRRSDLVLLLLAAGPIVYFCGVHLFFVSSLRYRLPAEYPLLALTAVGLRSSLPARWFLCCREVSSSPNGAGGATA